MAAAFRSLSDALEDLKVRSGLSYEGIGRKAHVSKSTVHRYCTGLSQPQNFGVVERIGLACGATRAEMLLLHRLWVRTTEPDGTEPHVPAITLPETDAITIHLDEPFEATPRTVDVPVESAAYV
ncbi:helix-turn-helix domain-containing protein, partial [Kibdelosporangium lantanae]